MCMGFWVRNLEPVLEEPLKLSDDERRTQLQLHRACGAPCGDSAERHSLLPVACTCHTVRCLPAASIGSKPKRSRGGSSAPYGSMAEARARARRLLCGKLLCIS